MRVAPESADCDDFPSRQKLIWVALAEIAFLLVIVVSFWAAYVWPIVIVILGSTNTIATLIHFRASYDAKYNQCCCPPSSASQSLLIFSAVVLAFSIVASGTSIIASIFNSSTSRVFSIICVCGLSGLGIVQCLKIYLLRRIRMEYRTWEMTRAAISVTIAPISHVVSGQPIITTAQTHFAVQSGGYPTSQDYPRQDRHDTDTSLQGSSSAIPHFAMNDQPYDSSTLGYI